MSYLRHSKTELNCHDLRMYSAQLRKYAQKNIYFSFKLFLFFSLFILFFIQFRGESKCVNINASLREVALEGRTFNFRDVCDISVSVCNSVLLSLN